jgi:hypothetical protein
MFDYYTLRDHSDPMLRLLLGIVVVLVAACGGAQTTPESTPENAPDASPTVAADPVEPNPGDGPACWCGEPIDPACVDTCAANEEIEAAIQESGE